MPTISKEDVAAIIADEDLEQLTAKTVRVKLEEKLGLESKVPAGPVFDFWKRVLT